jgi:hypothetical protein
VRDFQAAATEVEVVAAVLAVLSIRGLLPRENESSEYTISCDPNFRNKMLDAGARGAKDDILNFFKRFNGSCR